MLCSIKQLLDIVVSGQTVQQKPFQFVKMPNRETLEIQIASVMEILAKTAVAEICKIVDSGCVEFRLEMCRRQKEIEALRKKVHCLTRERTSTREARLDSVAPQQRTVGVQIDMDQGRL